jgi:hypothetical protein
MPLWQSILVPISIKSLYSQTENVGVLTQHICHNCYVMCFLTCYLLLSLESNFTALQPQRISLPIVLPTEAHENMKLWIQIQQQ